MTTIPAPSTRSATRSAGVRSWTTSSPSASIGAHVGPPRSPAATVVTPSRTTILGGAWAMAGRYR